MSRFVEELAVVRNHFSPHALAQVAETWPCGLGSRSAGLRHPFPSSSRTAPASGATAPVDYDGSVRMTVQGDRKTLGLTVRVPVTSLCPCSKEISDYGAPQSARIRADQCRG